MKPGDRVIVRIAYRARGVGSGKGGWKWEEREGEVEVISFTRAYIWVHVDAFKWWENPVRFPIDRVRLIDPERMTE